MPHEGLLSHFDTVITQARAYLDAIERPKLSEASPGTLTETLQKKFRVPPVAPDPEKGVKIRRPVEGRAEFEFRYYVKDARALAPLADASCVPKPSRWSGAAVSQEIIRNVVRVDVDGSALVAKFDGSVKLAKELKSFVDSYVGAINEDLLLINAEVDESLSRLVAQRIAAAKRAAHDTVEREEEDLKEAGFDFEDTSA